MTLSLRGLCKRHPGSAHAVGPIDLALPSAGYVCVMGPSGCGKTTLLRLVAGLERADAGSVALRGTPIDGLPPEARPTRLLFQSGALFPHLDVAANIGFALTLAGRRGVALAQRVRELAAMVELPEALLSRTPEGLSGGERQRVALARALADDPPVLLLDEPLSAIDRPQRASLRERLRVLQRQAERLFVHVTHDPDEALALADILVVMDEGRVCAQGPAEALYQRPPDRATARLLGELTAVPGDPRRALRPEHLREADAAGARARASVVSRQRTGECVELTLRSREAGPPLRLRALQTHANLGDEIGLCWDDDDVMDFPA
ncbi:MAG: ABC transporter ATP-binding protein [Nannocystaceae bacterium]